MTKKSRGRGRRSRQKVPNISLESAPVKKVPREARSGGDYYSLSPAWIFGAMDLLGPWGWCHGLSDTVKNEVARRNPTCACNGSPKKTRPQITERVLVDIRQRLSGFESQTWNEILGRRNHEVEIDGIARAAQVRLKELKHDDLDTLVSLTIDGKKRLWGFIINGCFNVLWWDPKHQVYPSKKKGT